MNALFKKIAGIFALVAAAGRAARAVENHQTPSASSLKALGISAKQMKQIHYI